MGNGQRRKESDMTARITRVLTALAIIVGVTGALSAPLGAQHEKHGTAGVAGKWTMNVEGSPHGATTMGLTLKQDGQTVTGTFASPHGDMPVKGEFVDGTLTLSTVPNDDAAITFKARLKEDGSLSGYVSSSMGDMTWTATRTQEGK
jgi:hypothetical protein